jgi:hypothetical protein
MVKPFGRFFAVKVIGLSPVAATLNKKGELGRTP